MSEGKLIDKTTPMCLAVVLDDKSAVDLDWIKGLDSAESNLHYWRTEAFPSILVSMTVTVHLFPGVSALNNMINGSLGPCWIHFLDM